jgi:UDP-N-acetylglucosamine--N-acetylmuramyl-(pentapeptide) pyrophosphoryl-undecaprenol N-acetylglucosamine transferase
LTVSELAVAGLGAILVPYPHAVDDHQTRNAAYLADAGAAEIMQEKDMDPVKLAACLEPLLSDRPRMLEMAANGRSVAISDAAQQVVDACEAWVKP